MKLSTRPSAELVAWAAERLKAANGAPVDASAMGVEDSEGRILGVVMFTNWEPWFGTIECSAAADDARWLLAREAINRMWAYAFETCGVQKVWARTPLKNKRALRMVKALGMTFEAKLPRQFGNDDAIISHRFREEWTHGRQVATTRAA